MKNLFVVVVALLSFILIGCNDDDDSSMVGTAKVELRLTDAPAQYEEVNIDVQQIVFKMNGDDDIHFPLENPGIRSEEHTSELQSRGHLVCRLLLEKKNANYRA